jgi:hypothetical protein
MRTFIAVLVILSFCAATTFAEQKNLVELHKNAGGLSNKECLSCHSDITKRVTLKKKIKTFHRLHLESKRDTPKECSDCHRSVDLREGSAAALRKQVDPAICQGCHDGSVKGAKALFAK